MAKRWAMGFQVRRMRLSLTCPCVIHHDHHRWERTGETSSQLEYESCQITRWRNSVDHNSNRSKSTMNLQDADISSQLSYNIYHWSHESHWIPFWFDLTGLLHKTHGYFQFGPGFADISPLSRIKVHVNRVNDPVCLDVDRFDFKMAE